MHVTEATFVLNSRTCCSVSTDFVLAD